VIFLAHRGLWKRHEERNTLPALQNALAAGFGIETDVRDACGNLVIAHDPPGASAPALDELLAMLKTSAVESTIALNIKADGLHSQLRSLLKMHSVQSYFCFDMSIPQAVAYAREGVRFFTRESEVEPVPALYAEASGIWMDMFQSDWATPSRINEHIRSGKEVALTSPELHGRPYQPFWDVLRDSNLACLPRLMLCTDHAESAREFFS